MPGFLVGPLSGFTDRAKGKGLVSSSWLSQIGKSTAQAPGGGNVSTQFSVAGIGNGADTTEDTLFTAALPAQLLDLPGRSIWLQAWGNVGALSATKTIKMYFGATITQSIVWTTTQTGAWQIFMEIYKQANNVQLALIQYDAIGATLTRNLTVASGSENDQAAITVKVTGQSSVATANTVTANSFIVSAFN